MALASLFLFALVAVPCFADVSSGPFLWYDSVRGRPYTVTYDNRSFIIDGQRTLLLGGSVHYPRFAPYQWKEVLIQMKADGLNHVQIYVFWNYHEHDHNVSSGVHSYDFTGRGDLPKFLETAAEVGLFVNLRIGPYVCAEWNFGGIPIWIRDVPGIKFRDYNQPWMDQMGTFVRAIGQVAAPYLAKNGGPIVLAQIENEYVGSQDYVEWCGQLADSLNFQVPWVMCNGASASNTINTANADDGARDYAEWHEKTYPQHPLAWTENEGWFQTWNDEPYSPHDNRTAQDIANVVAKWFAVGAAHHNYYMYFGGNHIGTWAAASLTNMYADGANYHADSTPNEPKRSHLNRLHHLLGSYNDALMSSGKQIHNATKVQVVGDPVGTGTDCDDKSTVQQIDVVDCDSNGDQPCTIRFNGTLCLQGDSYAMPVPFHTCDPSNQNQLFKWLPATKQLINVGTNQCLDIAVNTFQLDMWPCKSAGDADNQQWTYQASGTTHRLQSAIQNKCTTASFPEISAYTYGTDSRRIVFLTNTFNSQYTINWEGKSYTIPQQSVTIVDYQGNELFQTAQVNYDGIPLNRVYTPLLNSSNLKWEAYTEERVYSDAVSHPTPQEQYALTRDNSEYLVYTTQTDVDTTQTNFQLVVEGRTSMALLAFINGEYKGQAYDARKTNSGNTFTLNFQLANLTSKTINITLVSVSFGLECGFWNQQGPEQQDKKGITGAVKLNGNALAGPWGHRVQIHGEKLQIFTPAKTDTVSWSAVPAATSIPALTWFRTRFDRPSTTDDVIVLQFATGNGFTDQSRGHFFLNGVDLGHYFGKSVNGKTVQSSYFLPKDLINDKDNLFVYVDEAGGTHPSIVTIASTRMEVPKP